MKNTGFVIAISSKRSGFFTSSSAYDRAQWIPLKEATVYYSIEQAEKAASHLRRNGNFGATVIPLTEFDLDSEPSAPSAPASKEMAAHNTGDVCDNCAHDPCTCPSEDEDDEEDIKGEEYDKDPAVEYEIETVADPAAKAMSCGEVEPIRAPGSKKDIKEAEEVAVIQYKTAETGYENAADGVRNDDVPVNKYKVPAIILADLKKAVDEHTQNAEAIKDHSADDASMCLTVANACQTLLDYLSTGTDEGMKRAQVAYTSFMSPITTKIPANISDFILTCAKKSLKEMFNEKRDADRKILESEDYKALSVDELKAKLEKLEADFKDSKVSGITASSQKESDAIDNWRDQIADLKKMIEFKNKRGR